VTVISDIRGFDSGGQEHPLPSCKRCGGLDSKRGMMKHYTWLSWHLRSSVAYSEVGWCREKSYYSTKYTRRSQEACSLLCELSVSRSISTDALHPSQVKRKTGAALSRAPSRRQGVSFMFESMSWLLGARCRQGVRPRFRLSCAQVSRRATCSDIQELAGPSEVDQDMVCDGNDVDSCNGVGWWHLRCRDFVIALVPT
jgi:hypothetical protein